jgi:heme exporter protein D
MNWHSWSEFVAMGGYASYVWGSFGVAALVLVVECIAVSRRRKAFYALPPEDELQEQTP